MVASVKRNYLLFSIVVLLFFVLSYTKKSKDYGCIQNYDNALSDNLISLKDLAAKDYGGLNNSVGGTITGMNECNDDLSTIKPIPEFLIMRNNVVGNISSIILVILEFF
ncbi:PREDICTED: uncharacterized protein LOC109126882 [Camelina sativa]|uniref:Uncharacterized protein LOC109126882 n=1 Tax=Camelina sativa TaxID=90675 RepID=A0ABM1QHT2_CAMSA|nr:PREDICTED: uncharacterized protein LOC109126882 [Camelina sativa]